jgi:predicted DNA-binding transcriptional regulator AlpA
MRSRQRSAEVDSATHAHRQLSLAIGAPAAGARSKPVTRQPLGGRTLKRALAMDEILWMRDVVQLTGKHRCTIHRWMNRGVFPQKNAPRDRPTGWLRSTIERWLLGPPPTTRRGV